MDSYLKNCLWAICLYWTGTWISVLGAIALLGGIEQLCDPLLWQPLLILNGVTVLVASFMWFVWTYSMRKIKSKLLSLLIWNSIPWLFITIVFQLTAEVFTGNSHAVSSARNGYCIVMVVSTIWVAISFLFTLRRNGK